ncbi:MAG: tRNA (adenosine(37)-N6)-threonylcarbamoyltransferase complex ATPase subunit type 1 TsaE [Gammaproteobacteria bacterium]|nr:tRNA (adenosine(37)-N6)-threonylcarbamoyltransferase complex ATPase subunit type 1 TsaE [Gammaproteobacteria bacterium]
MKDELTPSAELVLPLQNVEDTEQLGAALATALSDGLVVFLLGDLGAGKTCLVRGALRELGYSGAVKSPTYTLLEEYSVAGREIIHFDLYRLSDPEELDLIGIRDYFNGKNCCFVEWPQRGQGYLPAEDVQIQISLEGDGRLARITSNSESGKMLLKSIQTELCQES